uniref:Peptidase S1 domain-containing protein n=1 Tax=Anopheles culicifacies TaxID=139723 RepID=A0A182MDF5_9DIPT
MGQPTYLREFAHMAAIGWTQPDGSITWNCGGSLIWENFILTAAHCVADANNNKPDVARFGDLDLFNDTDDQYAQQIKIVEIVRHPEHTFRARYHDIALMRLEHKVKVHDTVAPVCLWIDDEIRFKTFEATGWGDTGFACIWERDDLPDPEFEMSGRGLLELNKIDVDEESLENSANVEYPEDMFVVDEGGPAFWTHEESINYVVGIASHSAPNDSSVHLHTRIEPYAIANYEKDVGHFLSSSGSSGSSSIIYNCTTVQHDMKFPTYIRLDAN